jgi:DNA-binding Lrp family transcriptional regulator
MMRSEIIQTTIGALPLDELDRRLLDDFQREFPLHPRPFAALAERLGLDEAEVLARLHRLQAEGAISRIGAVLTPDRGGWSMLAAMAVPAEELDEVAALVGSYAEVHHSYERQHQFNLWFVVTAPRRERVERVLQEIETRSACPVLDLPLLEAYSPQSGFAVSGNEVDRRLIAAIQDALPLVPCPYAAIGRRIGLGEVEVIAGLRRLIEGGVIERFGVIVRHRELGYRANALVVWDVPDDRIGEVGQIIAAVPFISLCHRRPRRLPAWPYNLFCMIHGRDRDAVEGLAEMASAAARLERLPRAVLFSRRRFKERGARAASAP